MDKKIIINGIYRAISVIIPVLALGILAGCSDMVVLHPKGKVGHEEFFLIRIAFMLMLIVIIPVLVMAVWFVLKYRIQNKKAKYLPDWGGSKPIEWFIWLIPVAIIIILSYLTVVYTYRLDPYKPIASKNEPVKVDVISLDWKWLFIYPELDIATVNQIVFPVNTPLEMRLTSNSVMTSFFIPQLGSQMYAMARMQTRLNLIASDTGTFSGHNQSFSGKGYEKMSFEAKSVTEDGFDKWVRQVKKAPESLDSVSFNNLKIPSVGNPIVFYSGVKSGIFDEVIREFKSNTVNVQINSSFY